MGTPSWYHWYEDTGGSLADCDILKENVVFSTATTGVDSVLRTDD